MTNKSTDNLITKYGESFYISAQALHITHGSENAWKWIKPSSPEESVFSLVAELIQVQGIDVSGKLDLSKYKLANKTYEVIFIIKFTDDAFGSNKKHIKFEVISPESGVQENGVNLDTFIFTDNGVKPGVQEIHAGEFISNGKGILGFGMHEIEVLNGGLILEEVIVKPKVIVNPNYCERFP